MTDNIVADLHPTNPAVEGQTRADSTSSTLNNIGDSTGKVNEFVNLPMIKVPPFEHPFLIEAPVYQGGGKKADYFIFFQNKKFTVKAKDLQQAVKEAYKKLDKKTVKIMVQKKNKKRENKIYTFSITTKNKKLIITKN